MCSKTGMKLMLLVILTGLVLGQAQPKLEISIKDEKVNLTLPEQKGEVDIFYEPGDTIRYLVNAANVGSALMTEAAVTDPIPLGTTYVFGSAKAQDASAVFSIDAGKSFMVWPPTYRVRDASGNEIIQKATPEMVTHIKWSIEKSLEAKESTDMEFMVEVNQ